MSGQKGRDAVRTDCEVGGDRAATEYRQPLLKRISPFLECVQAVADPSGRRGRWTPAAASMAAVLMALDPGCALGVRCEDALASLGRERAHRCVGRTYNGLLKALERQAHAVLPVLKTDLRRHARMALEKIPRVAGWTLLAVDGSKEELPRTRSHEATFGIADNGVFPQAFVTTVVEVQTGLPWDGRIGPARSSEKAHLIEMIPELPADALLLADANFGGYPIWSALHAAGMRFLLRVGGAASLIRGLWPRADIECRGDIVYVWPVNHQKQVAPLRLRLIRAGSRKNPVYLLTNVIDPRVLSKPAAGRAYRMRWGVELFYRTLKRTLGYAKLRSRSGRRARIELEWGLIAAAISTMLGVQIQHRRRIDPRRLSPASLIRALRRALLRGGNRPDLDRAIAAAVRDRYARRGPKQARHRPITKNTPFPLTLKPPRIRPATPSERRRALHWRDHLAA